jgi:hypothetical protein
MKNILEEALKEASTKNPERGDSAQGFRLQALVSRLAKELSPEEAYLEVGGGDGEYFGRALQGRNGITAFAAVTPTELTSGGSEVFKSFVQSNAKAHPSCAFYDGDFFLYMANSGAFPKPVGIYFYDGMCRQSSLRAAAGRARKFLAPQSIFLVGHWAQAQARKGTWEGIEMLRPRSVRFREVGMAERDDIEGFGDGLGAFYLEI